MKGNITLTEPLISVVYVSSAAQPFSQEELVEVVRRSQKFNTSRGITGMLLHKDGNFMQVLEGPESEVFGVIKKIEKDPRHKGILHLIKKPIVERQFDEWSMGFRDLNTLSNEELVLFGPYLSQSLADEKFQKEPTAAFRLLRSFREKLR